MMGPHAHLLTPTERWKVVNYVKKLSLGEALKTEGDPSEQITGNDFDEKKMEVIDVPVEQLELLDKAFKKIEFGPGNADLLPSSYPGLTKVVQYLVENPSYRIFLQGHTESGKDEVKNITLSRDRVKALEKYFVTSGIVAERVEYKGFGSGMPIADNTTEAGRQKNRRIEFTLIK